MAIKLNYEVGNDLYPGAYLKVQKIIGSSNTVESYETEPDGSQVLKMVSEPEHMANIFVYPDEEARRNNARPLHYFGIEFDYDLDSGGNIYKVAYTALKAVKRFKGEVITDV
tara:strand:+ start:2746 stop:3081 length:336 start_codon:yes stop_codon:yes gene_type:complete